MRSRRWRRGAGEDGEERCGGRRWRGVGGEERCLGEEVERRWRRGVEKKGWRGGGVGGRGEVWRRGEAKLHKQNNVLQSYLP